MRKLLPLAVLFVPFVASAHEVYVLTPQEIANGIATPPFNMFAVVANSAGQFFFWGFIAFLVVSTVFAISISRRLERIAAPYLSKAKRYAPLVARVTIGIGLIASAYHYALFGPELPLPMVFGSAAPLVALAMALCGLSIMFNVAADAAGLLAIILFGIAALREGHYMLTYANYLGEFIVLLVGVHVATARRGDLARLRAKLAPFAFPVLRIAFGICLLYAALYAKVFHNQLALQVASLPLAGHPYPVSHYLGFEPHFLVLGAAIIETVIALFFIFGIEIRHTSLFLEFWLALSLIFFGEAVWPHLVLIGLPIAFILHGYDNYSLEGRFFKKRKLEPIL